MKSTIEIIREARDILYDAGELNMGNYDESEVRALNDGATDAYMLLHHFLLAHKVNRGYRPSRFPYNSTTAY